ncbi:MucB/RseB C-terminal domain-containing protein [Uliginosibacterium sp. H1]|uniref:MucB/RseB C-terminal domain-containing protein n=1 Tax=Uliginosibacterium sp. H1 TaxID=3114757 RepID=UPI002E19C075|nr:MucB/RseB C-terminal domain-containing protein [Uliginosibacterium sp. H1]
MIGARWLTALLLVCGAQAFAAESSQSTAEAMALLQRMSQAARGLNYSGVFVYQVNGRTETSRITHFSDASGEQEKLETLDGPVREVIRIKDEVRCYLPNDKMVVLDRAGSVRFPGRVISMVSALPEHYEMRVGAPVRIAGRDAIQLSLFPRDEFRYGYKLWADKETGLLLRARLVNAKGDVLEHFGFSEIALHITPDKEKVRSRYADQTDWVVVNARGGDVRPDDVSWTFKGVPPGFRQVSSIRRPLRKDGAEAYHAVFSDGLASISVFVEPAVESRGVTPQPSNSGPIGIYKRMYASQMITAIGEVPMAALQAAADGVSLRSKPSRSIR